MNKHLSRFLGALGGILFISACATTGPMETQPDVSAPVIQSIDVTDDQIAVQFNTHFDYTIYKPGDPFTVVVQFPGADPGQFREKISSVSRGVTEITPVVVTEPSLTTKLEILLQNPGNLIPEVTDNTLVLRVEEEQAPPSAEAGLPSPEEGTPATAELAPPVQEEVKEEAMPQVE
ncbi:MAG: hypothetical protein ACM34I_05355, partial [bacterium]